MDDPSYTAWLKIYHPTEVCSTTTKSLSSLVLSKDSAGSGKSKLSSDDALSEILALPHPVPRNKSKRKPALNAKAVCITKDNVLKDLKKKEAEKAEAEKEKEAKRLERERKKKIREEKRLEREQKKVREEKRLFEEQKKKKRAVKPVKSGRKTRSRTQGRAIDDVLASLHLSSSSDSDEDSDSPGDSEDNTTCPKCGIRYIDSPEP